MGTERRTLIRDRIRHAPKEKPLDAAFHNAVCRSLRSNVAVEGSRCQIKPMPKATDDKHALKCIAHAIGGNSSSPAKIATRRNFLLGSDANPVILA
jgi:hypothetical protein